MNRTEVGLSAQQQSKIEINVQRLSVHFKAALINVFILTMAQIITVHDNYHLTAVPPQPFRAFKCFQLQMLFRACWMCK